MPIAPYGTWESPITAEAVTRAGLRFADVLRIDDGSLYWVESRPTEGGRSVVVRRGPDGEIGDVTPAGGNTRTRVHEYGGAAYTVAGGVTYASEFEDQRLYRIEGGYEPIPITPEPEIPAGLRYADAAVGDVWLVCVRERHLADGEPVNELVRIPLDGSSEPVVAASGHDFYAAPRLSPDRSQLAWLTWDHPNMPWNGTSLWVADLDAAGMPSEPRLVAGGPSESIFQPEWSPEGVLHFCSDRTGWWNLYRADGYEIVPVHLADGDVGVPQWVFGTSRYAFCGDGSILAVVKAREGLRLDVIGDGDAVRSIPAPGTSLGATLCVDGSTAYLLAGSADRFVSVTAVDIATGAARVLAAPEPLDVPRGSLSTPEQVAFDTPDGPTYAHFYPPRNPEFTAPEGQLPPLLVLSHGGPTAATNTALDPGLQFWTSRGFAVLDVDYGGSTGYGRAYWERLAGTWGIVDVRDCAAAAGQVAAAGRADPARLAIRGGSAGGFTTLAALAFTDVFAAGASHFGVGDLRLLAEHTHKFESRYLDWLVGPLPEADEIYRERSPLHHADRITCPIILLQGLEDRVVPPEQATTMAAALRANGVPVAHLEFEGEGHGFRAAENQIKALEAELSFYGRVFGFEPAGDIAPVEMG